MESNKLAIEFCMGSSCYSRGNGANVDLIEKLIEDQGLQEYIQLRGRLCSSQCAKGPCITIDGIQYTNVRPDAIEGLVQRHIEEKLDVKQQSNIYRENPVP